jgi:hypothetical protein
MNDAIKYLEESFGKHIWINPEPLNTNLLPTYLSVLYSIREASLYNHRVCFAEYKGSDLLTPAQYEKQQALIKDYLRCPVVFLFDRIESYNRNRLQQHNIDFVVTDRQIFMPAMLIHLKDYLKPIQRPKQNLTPAAQCLLLYHLEKHSLEGFGFQKISNLLRYSYLTITRAVDVLVVSGLCELEGTKEKTLKFDKQKKKIWEKALPMLINPVKKGLYINDHLSYNYAVQTNINALAHYSNINDEGRRYLAISVDNFRRLYKEGRIRMFSEYDGEFFVEQWKYDPMLLAEDEYIDRLSLFLIFRNDPDERINHEINQLISNFPW